MIIIFIAQKNRQNADISVLVQTLIQNMDTKNRKLSLADRLQAVDDIQESHCVENLRKFIDYITGDPSVPIEAIGENMQSAILEVLKMENPEMAITDDVIVTIEAFLKERRRKLGLFADDKSNDWMDVVNKDW